MIPPGRSVLMDFDTGGKFSGCMVEICPPPETTVQSWATNYGNCVTVKTNSLGLGLSVLWLLRPGHPPLLIPWADITIHRVRRSRFFSSLVEFKFRSEPSVPVRIYNKLFLKILASSDGYYPNFRQIFGQIGTPTSKAFPKTSHF